MKSPTCDSHAFARGGRTTPNKANLCYESRVPEMGQECARDNSTDNRQDPKGYIKSGSEEEKALARFQEQDSSLKPPSPGEIYSSFFISTGGAMDATRSFLASFALLLLLGVQLSTPHPVSLSPAKELASMEVRDSDIAIEHNPRLRTVGRNNSPELAAAEADFFLGGGEGYKKDRGHLKTCPFISERVFLD